MSEPKKSLGERIEALVWSLENRMATHDDVLALDAIKLEVEMLERRKQVACDERSALERVISEQPCDCLRTQSIRGYKCWRCAALGGREP